MGKLHIPIFLVAIVLVSFVASGQSTSMQPMARIGGGGGMDSGGGNGLFYRLKNAMDLSLEVLAIVKTDDLRGAAPRVVDFYKSNRKKLIIEATTTEVITKPQDQVFVVVGGIKKFEKMVTGLFLGAPILVADDLNVVDPVELTATLLHELGHHLGIPEEEDGFLDQVALALVERAIEINPTFKDKVTSCLKSERVMEKLAGNWVGSGKTPWNPVYQVSLKLNSNGTYSSSSRCQWSPCPPAFYYDTNADSPKKKFMIHQACGGSALGTIDILFSTGSVMRDEIRYLKLSDDGNSLSFEVYHAQKYGPLEYHLKRSAQ